MIKWRQAWDAPKATKSFHLLHWELRSSCLSVSCSTFAPASSTKLNLRSIKPRAPVPHRSSRSPYHPQDHLLAWLRIRTCSCLKKVLHLRPLPHLNPLRPFPDCRRARAIASKECISKIDVLNSSNSCPLSLKPQSAIWLKLPRAGNTIE